MQKRKLGKSNLENDWSVSAGTFLKNPPKTGHGNPEQSLVWVQF